MKWHTRFTIKFATAALVCALPFLATESQAMPSFARQTGMVCNSCHIGTDNVPNFTRTGRIFAMRGYMRPVVREKLRTEGQTEEGEPQYGGQYVSLNWTDFFAARLISSFAAQSKTNGVKSDVTGRPLSRMALFYTGPITDWLGLWTEIGYLGNDTLRSVSVANPGPTGQNTFAFDEYRLSTSRTIGPDSFIGMSLGNEPGDVVTQFVFPTGHSALLQPGTGRRRPFAGHEHLEPACVPRTTASGCSSRPTPGSRTTAGRTAGSSTTPSPMTCSARPTTTCGWAWNTRRGNDNASILTPTKSSFICPTTCPAGVTDSSLSFTNTLGGRSVAGAPVEKVSSFRTYAVRAEWVAADRGPHTWVAMVQAGGTKQDYVSGATAKRDVIGAYIRYFYKRTYGFQASYARDTGLQVHEPDRRRERLRATRYLEHRPAVESGDELQHALQLQPEQPVVGIQQGHPDPEYLVELGLGRGVQLLRKQSTGSLLLRARVAQAALCPGEGRFVCNP